MTLSVTALSVTALSVTASPCHLSQRERQVEFRPALAPPPGELAGRVPPHLGSPSGGAGWPSSAPPWLPLWGSWLAAGQTERVEGPAVFHNIACSSPFPCGYGYATLSFLTLRDRPFGRIAKSSSSRANIAFAGAPPLPCVPLADAKKDTPGSSAPPAWTVYGLPSGSALVPIALPSHGFPWFAKMDLLKILLAVCPNPRIVGWRNRIFNADFWSLSLLLRRPDVRDGEGISARRTAAGAVSHKHSSLPFIEIYRLDIYAGRPPRVVREAGGHTP